MMFENTRIDHGRILVLFSSTNFPSMVDQVEGRIHRRMRCNSLVYDILSVVDNHLQEKKTVHR